MLMMMCNVFLLFFFLFICGVFDVSTGLGWVVSTAEDYDKTLLNFDCVWELLRGVPLRKEPKQAKRPKKKGGV